MPEMPVQKSSDYPSSLNEYFHRELIKNLSELNTIISVEQGKRLSKQSFAKAGAIIEDIHDLSMVHGFDSIEAIAEKLATTALRLNYTSTEDLNEVFVHIRSGIRAIIDILKISNDLLRGATAKSAQVPENTARPSQKQAEPFFDIKEIDSLMNLIEEQTATVDPGPETEKNGLEQAFEEVFREEGLESLNQFTSSIQNLKSGKMSTENLLRLKNAVFSLRDAALSYQVDTLDGPLVKLIDFCENELKTGFAASSGQILILEKCAEMFGTFVAAFPEQNFSQQDFSQIFTTDFPDLSLNTPAETEPPGKSPETQPQIKAKISVTKEEIRRRWILKKH